MSIERRKKWLAIGGFAAAVYAVGNLFSPAVVVGESMSPTLHSGKLIWVDRTYYKVHRPQPGEVIVFRLDGMTYIKRVYRGPGEKVYYLSSGLDWIGAVREPRVPEVRERFERPRGNIRVKAMNIPKDSVFVLGDNYTRSIDSRQLGPIPLSDVIGRARLPIDPTRNAEYEYGAVTAHRVLPGSVAKRAVRTPGKPI